MLWWLLPSYHLASVYFNFFKLYHFIWIVCILHEQLTCSFYHCVSVAHGHRHNTCVYGVTQDVYLLYTLFRAYLRTTFQKINTPRCRVMSIPTSKTIYICVFVLYYPLLTVARLLQWHFTSDGSNQPSRSHLQILEVSDIKRSANVQSLLKSAKLIFFFLRRKLSPYMLLDRNITVLLCIFITIMTY